MATRDMATRDRVIAAIYDAVIRPSYYGAFMEAWRAHIAQAVTDPVDKPGQSDDAGVWHRDPELRAHFTRAYEILERMGRAAPDNGLQDRVAQADGFVILAAPDGRILAAGAAARMALGGRSRLEALEAVLTANSANLLRDLLQRLRLDDFPDAPLVLATGTQPRHLIVRSETATGTAAPLFVIEALDYHWDHQAEQMLIDSFALSPAEVEIVRNLMAGYSLREIALRSHRSEHTVRNQAKAVLAKTGAPGQADLIRLVAFLIRTEPAGHGNTAGFVGLPHEIMQMRTGLGMQVFKAGAADGRPVIFLHGMQDGMAPLQVLQQGLQQRGFQVIAPVRPGFGLSDPVANAEAALSVYPDHVVELIDRLRMRRPLILGHMAGAIYGHVLTGRLAGQLSGMLAVAGAVPVLRADDMGVISSIHRVVAYTALYAPALLPFVLRAAIAQIDSTDFDTFLKGVFKPGSHDHGVIERLNLVAPIRAGYRFSVQQGHKGFAADAHLVVRDWRARIASPAAPVILLHGQHDLVASPEMVRAFAQGRANVELRLEPRAGQLILYQFPEAVLDAMDEMIRGDAVRTPPGAG